MTSSSTPEIDSSTHEVRYQRLAEEQEKNPYVVPQPTDMGIEYPPRRLELPLFKGIDPNGWIFRAKRYFDINGFSADERLRGGWFVRKGKP